MTPFNRSFTLSLILSTVTVAVPRRIPRATFPWIQIRRFPTHRILYRLEMITMTRVSSLEAVEKRRVRMKVTMLILEMMIPMTTQMMRTDVRFDLLTTPTTRSPEVIFVVFRELLFRPSILGFYFCSQDIPTRRYIR